MEALGGSKRSCSGGRHRLGLVGQPGGGGGEGGWEVAAAVATSGLGTAAPLRPSPCCPR